MNASPGLIHMVQEALNSPMSHAPVEDYGNWTIQELACWIMGFEHAMQMVEDYIKCRTTSTAPAVYAGDK